MGTLSKIFLFYYEGFRSMTIGRTLWLIIIIKLVIMFAVLRLFFFPNFLSEKCGDDDTQKSEFVGVELIDRATNE